MRAAAPTNQSNATVLLSESMERVAEAAAVTVDAMMQLCAVQAACEAQVPDRGEAGDVAVSEGICALLGPSTSAMCSFNASAAALRGAAAVDEALAEQPQAAGIGSAEWWIASLIAVGAATLLGNSAEYHSSAWLPVSLAAAVFLLACVTGAVEWLAPLRRSAEQTRLGYAAVMVAQVALPLLASCFILGIVHSYFTL